MTFETAELGDLCDSVSVFKGSSDERCLAGRGKDMFRNVTTQRRQTKIRRPE